MLILTTMSKIKSSILNRQGLTLVLKKDSRFARSASMECRFKLAIGQDMLAITLDVAKVFQEGADSRHIFIFTKVLNHLNAPILDATRVFLRGPTWSYILEFTLKKSPSFANYVEKHLQPRVTWKIMSAVISNKSKFLPILIWWAAVFFVLVWANLFFNKWLNLLIAKF
jgi:hypothetical protein